MGLSEKYLQKGAVGLDKSVTEALTGRPVAIFDAANDPRMQYPKEAQAEGIASLVAIPMMFRGKVIGVMRLVTAEPREFTMDEVDFACGVAELGAQADQQCPSLRGPDPGTQFSQGPAGSRQGGQFDPGRQEGPASAG